MGILGHLAKATAFLTTLVVLGYTGCHFFLTYHVKTLGKPLCTVSREDDNAITYPFSYSLMNENCHECMMRKRTHDCLMYNETVGFFQFHTLIEPVTTKHSVVTYKFVFFNDYTALAWNLAQRVKAFIPLQLLSPLPQLKAVWLEVVVTPSVDRRELDRFWGPLSKMGGAMIHKHTFGVALDLQTKSHQDVRLTINTNEPSDYIYEIRA